MGIPLGDQLLIRNGDDPGQFGDVFGCGHGKTCNGTSGKVKQSAVFEWKAPLLYWLSLLLPCAKECVFFFQPEKSFSNK